MNSITQNGKNTTNRRLLAFFIPLVAVTGYGALYIVSHVVNLSSNVLVIGMIVVPVVFYIALVFIRRNK